MKKSQPKIGTKKPVVKASRSKASRPAVKVPVAPATPAISLSPSVAAHGGLLWSLTLPQALLLVGLMAAAAFVLVARGGGLKRAMADLRARAMARRRMRAHDVAPWQPELWIKPVLHEPPPEPVQPERLLSKPALEAVSVETEKPASVEEGPEPEPIPNGALPTDR